ncbi:MAG: hypothetical protein ETSY2_02725 [Candidatus Entotheonella gemina]|uniref:Uncharacterized protein n=1 Tax=Candidatus Entotheonella gemina TaxID=1429439 RepID=W4MFE2_9BACT|nr:MAG: hypothetical protein ETSY2_02725 [Candidatus Entotheonella gemina]
MHILYIVSCQVYESPIQYEILGYLLFLDHEQWGDPYYLFESRSDLLQYQYE